MSVSLIDLSFSARRIEVFGEPEHECGNGGCVGWKVDAHALVHVRHAVHALHLGEAVLLIEGDCAMVGGDDHEDV
jgi:hypothetical protein